MRSLKITKPLNQKQAIELKAKMPEDAEIYADGKFFKSNGYGTGLLAWSETLNRWIMWLHPETECEVFTKDEILNTAAELVKE